MKHENKNNTYTIKKGNSMKNQGAFDINDLPEVEKQDPWNDADLALMGLTYCGECDHLVKGDTRVIAMMEYNRIHGYE